MQENKISCIIVDDEPFALELIQNYVSKTPFLELKGKCSNAFDALELLNTEKIDLVFLDIQMPELSGLELSKTISKETRIIFTTAFNEYALDGFKADALDYLMKPFNFEEFYNASLKAKEWFGLKRNKTSESTVTNDFIFVKSEYKQLKIKLNEVLYFEGLKDYIKIWLVNQPKAILTLMSLKSLEEELSESQFMRIHRSFIVALDKIEAVERNQVIINKQRITVAEQYKSKFQNFIGKNSI
ncbi:LytTR family DNA-binding domain-containing protein [Flavobacterium pectinovorum]|uniref:LytR/AlgR family response regulator transcription factor n=1 Tax=Flavobacterium pectinovorum TaxID=29533 RepID=UPI00265DEBDF|nr:LytTR family DNA-binding domain-containing protein [Flavobacterium pectinovorum]WKL49796.1 LytTR family DNA-binding domain-containing protein [Flavobacterium pectinovorum]